MNTRRITPSGSSSCSRAEAGSSSARRRRSARLISTVNSASWWRVFTDPPSCNRHRRSAFKFLEPTSFAGSCPLAMTSRSRWKRITGKRAHLVPHLPVLLRRDLCHCQYGRHRTESPAAFDFPTKGGTYDNFSITVDEQPLSVPIDTNAGVGESSNWTRDRANSCGSATIRGAFPSGVTDLIRTLAGCRTST